MRLQAGRLSHAFHIFKLSFPNGWTLSDLEFRRLCRWRRTHDEYHAVTLSHVLNRFLGNIQLSGYSTQKLKLDETTLDKDADYFGDRRKRIRGRARREGID